LEKLIRYNLEDGSVFLVETDLPLQQQQIQPVARGLPANVAIVDAGTSFEESLKGVVPIATAVVEKFNKMGPKFGPDRLDVEFGLKMGGEAGVIIASASVEANFRVTLHWDRKRDDSKI
jgi:hypothetical protein